MSQFRVITPGGTLYGLPVPRMPVISTVESLTGWWDLPQAEGGSVKRPYADGAWAEGAHYGGRTIVVQGAFAGDDPAMVRDAFEAFKRGLSAKELRPFVVEELGITRYVMARLEGNPQFDWKGLRVATYNLQFFAPDYRRFGGDGTGPQYALSTTLPLPAAGTPVPWTYPMKFNGEESGGGIMVHNSGDAPPAVVGELVGPLKNPSIFTDDGQRQQFRITLAAGEKIHLDFDNRKVEAGGPGGPSRRGTMVGRWINFSGGNTRVRFNAEVNNPDARLFLRWSDATK